MRDAYVERGSAGLVSARRGKPSNRTMPGAFREHVLDIVRTHYTGFGPTLAHEKLVELHGLGPVTRDAARVDVGGRAVADAQGAP